MSTKSSGCRMWRTRSAEARALPRKSRTKRTVGERPRSGRILWMECIHKYNYTSKITYIKKASNRYEALLYIPYIQVQVSNTTTLTHVYRAHLNSLHLPQTPARSKTACCPLENLMSGAGQARDSYREAARSRRSCCPSCSRTRGSTMGTIRGSRCRCPSSETTVASCRCVHAPLGSAAGGTTASPSALATGTDTTSPSDRTSTMSASTTCHTSTRARGRLRRPSRSSGQRQAAGMCSSTRARSGALAHSSTVREEVERRGCATSVSDQAAAATPVPSWPPSVSSRRASTAHRSPPPGRASLA